MATKQIYDSSNLPISDADFESIKQSLVNFYKGTEEFKDYDYESSRMSQQMNMLAYVTLYNQQYSNVALYESFLRTAQTREAVVQNAQDKGYVPNSVSASKDLITVFASTLGDVIPNSINIPANTPFIGTVDGLYNYNFITWDNISIPYDDALNLYHYEIPIVQGYRAVQYFTYDSTKEIILFDDDIDRKYINVSVSESTNETTGKYDNWTSNSIVNLSSSKKVFYINETSDGYTRIYFGVATESEESENSGFKAYDYIGGLRPADGAKIKVEYLKTDGKVANGSVNYKFVGTLDSAVVNEVRQNPNNDPLYNGSYGGGDKESIERIRANASLYQETQSRCVTAYDYETFIKSNFGSYIQAVRAYGNSNNPGYVFLAIKPFDALLLTEMQQNEITTYLNRYNILTITPVIVEPDYLYVNHYVNINYYPSAVPEGQSYLKDQISNALDTYYTEEVELFGNSFHISKALKSIDSCNESILGSYMTITLIKEVNDSHIISSPATGINFMNPLLDVWSISEIIFTDDDLEENTISLFSINNDMIAGPFKEDDVNVDIPRYQSGSYSRTITAINENYDLENPGRYVQNTVVITDEEYYYKIGEVDKKNGTVTYDFNSIGIANRIYTNQLNFEATLQRTDVYSKDGGIIVFEPALKSEYLTISMEQIEHD